MQLKKTALMSLAIAAALTISAAAQGAFDSYVYNTEKEAVAAPDAVTLAAVYTGESMETTALNGASDL